MKFSRFSVVAFLFAVSPAWAAIELPPLESRLDRYEQRLIDQASENKQPSIDLLREVGEAQKAGKIDAAIEALEDLAGRHNAQGEGGFGTWLKLALAYQSKAASGKSLPAVWDGTAAAYGAYERAETDQERIEALSALGSLLLRAAEDPEEEEYYDPDEAEAARHKDITNREAARSMAYQVFTELGQLVADDRFDETIAELKPDFTLEKITYPPRPAQYGRWDYPCGDDYDTASDDGDEEATEDEADLGSSDTRVITSEEAQCEDNQAKQACLVFSGSLGANPDEVAQAIKVTLETDTTGKPSGKALDLYPAAVNQKSICYGLDYGASYKFVIDKSLKSAAGDPLDAETVAYLDMPDKAALLGFRRGTYVLPSKSGGTIAMDTVNVREARLMLRRIGDRNLVREILLNHILGGFKLGEDDTSDACFVVHKMSEGIADGSVSLPASPATLNQSVQLKLPVGEILDKREAWLKEDPRGEELPYSPVVDGTKLSMTLLGDQAAAASATGSKTGVFALFGAVTVPTTDDPVEYSGDSEEDCRSSQLASQWFIITDMGLSLQVSHADLYVLARSLATTDPVPGAKIELISRSGLVLGTGTTDEFGMATFPARLGRGAGGNELVAVMAHTDDDFAFLDKTDSSIDLADRGFGGRLGPEAELDAFVAPIRGIFRPGDNLDALILLRDLNAEAMGDLPPFEVKLVDESGGVIDSKTINPKGATEQTHATSEAELGAYRYSTTIPAQTRQGSARLVVTVAGREAGSANVQIRYFQPYTVGISKREGTWSGTVAKDGTLTLKGEARADYLYGVDKGPGSDAPAAGLAVEYEARIVPDDSPVPNCFEDFTFGQGRDDYRAELFTGKELATGKDGAIHIELPAARLTQPTVSFPLKAEVTIRVLEANAVAAESKFDVPLTLEGRNWIGAKVGGPRSLSPDRPLANQVTEPTVIQVVALDADKKPVTQNIAVDIERINNTFVWSRDGKSWDYVPDPAKQRTQVDKTTIAFPAKEGPDGCPAAYPTTIALGQTGNYVLELRGDKGGETDLPVNKGWTTAKDGRLDPDSLLVWVPKKEFARGEEIEVGVDTPYRSGSVLGELIANGKVLPGGTFEAAIDQKGRADAKIAVDDAWPRGAVHIYVTALRKPEGDDAALGPARAIGGTLIRIGQDRSDPKLTIDAPRKISTYGRTDFGDVAVNVNVEGLSDQARIVVAAVDEGILSVTNYKTPNPLDYYFGGRWFDFQVYDTYGRVLLGKFGGDELAGIRGMGYKPNDLVAWLSPIKKLEGGKASFAIPLGKGGIPPSFQGEVRIMVWAWDEGNFALGEHHMDVRDPIVVQLSAPDRMAPGDLAVVPLRVSAIDIGQQLSIEARVEGPLRLAADAAADADAGEPCQGAATDQCRLYAVDAKKGGSVLLKVPLKATDAPGIQGETAKVALSYSLSDQAVLRGWDVQVRQPYPPLVQSLRSVKLDPGATFTIDKGKFQQLAGPMDVNSLQLTARIAKTKMLPTGAGEAVADTAVKPLDALAYDAQLMLANAALSAEDGGATPPSQSPESMEKLKALARDMLLLQGADGQFVPSRDEGVVYLQSRGAGKRPDQSDPVGRTAFALDVLSRMNAVTKAADDAAINRSVGYLLSNLSNVASTGYEHTDCTRSHLYAANVLARLDRISSGFFQRVADSCAEALEHDAVGKLMLASAYNAFGLSEEAEAIEEEVDGGALTASGASPSAIARAVALFTENQAPDAKPILVSFDNDQTIDQATESWWARAQVALVKALKPDTLTISSDAIEITPADIDRKAFGFGVDIRNLTLDEVSGEPVNITNRGEEPLEISFLGEGLPASIEKAGEPKYAVTLNLIGLGAADKDGKIEVTQFQKIYGAVSINQVNDGYTAPQHLAVVQILPTGFQVVDAYHKLAWEKAVGNAVDASAVSNIDYVETTSDRWIVLPESTESGSESQLLALSLRPTIEGDFLLPPLVVRDLDNPARAGWTKPLRVIVKPATE